MKMVVLLKSLNQIWLIAVFYPVADRKWSSAVPWSCLSSLRQPEVCVTVNLCPLLERLWLLVQISVSSKVTSQRLPELKGSWVLPNGKEDSSWCLCSSGCSVLLFFGLDLRIDGVSLSGEGSKTWTGYRISKTCSLSNCSLLHADRSSDIKERSTYPPFRQAFRLPEVPVTCENVCMWERMEGRGFLLILSA